jgi:hypothetical protein
MQRSGSTWRIGVCVLVSALGAAGWWALSQVWAAPVVPRQQARTVRSEDDIKQLVVMLQGTLADQSFNGAGILIGQAPDRLYIATANHVVRQGTQQAERVQVQFRWLPGEPKEAKVLSDVELPLDLAVLVVSPTRELSIPELPWAALANPGSLKSGQKLFPIGFPAGVPWDKPQQSHLFHTLNQERILSDGTFINGHSGGAVVTEDLAIVGIALDMGSLRAESARIDSVLEKLRAWGYPVDLKLKTSTTPPDPGTKPPDTPPGGTKPPDSSTAPCAISGMVFDPQNNRPLSAVSIGLSWRPPRARPETLVRNVATTGPDGRFSFECPREIAAERYPLYLELSHRDWAAIHHTNVDVQKGEVRRFVNVPISPSTATRRDIPAPSDDCIAIDATTLKVEHHAGRGGWHVVAVRGGSGQLLLPDFESNEAGARALERIVRQYGVTDYCQIGRPPAAHYFLVRGIPVRTPLREERCRSFNAANLAVMDPNSSRAGRWSISEGGNILLSFDSAQVARSALEIIRRHGFSSACYPVRPVIYLR